MDSRNDKITVYLPDMFKTFLQEAPLINPHYQTVKHVSEQWMSKICSFSPKMQMKIDKCNFSYFCAITAPHAGKDELKTICDWGNWVFPFDDMFDEGEFRDNPIVATEVMETLRMGMDGRSYDGKKLPLVQVHDDVFARIAAKSSRGVQRRFASAMDNYCRGALIQVEDYLSGSIPSIEEIVALRRLSAGVNPLYHLVEYAHDLHIPDEVFEHPIIQQLQDLGSDMVAITNDIMSYRKEESDGVPHNMVAICRLHGMTAQEAFNTVGGFLDGRYAAWDATLAQLPSWNTQVDEDVSKYIEGIQNTVKANLNWSFQSERYLGANPALVRQTRQIEVLAQPSFLRSDLLKTTSSTITNVRTIPNVSQPQFASWFIQACYALFTITFIEYSSRLLSIDY